MISSDAIDILRKQETDPEEYKITINKSPVDFSQVPKPTENLEDELKKEKPQHQEIKPEKKEYKVPEALLKKVENLHLNTLYFFLKDAASAGEAERYIGNALRDGRINETTKDELLAVIDSNIFNPEQSEDIEEQFKSVRDEYIYELEEDIKSAPEKRAKYEQIMGTLSPGIQMPRGEPEKLKKAREEYEKIKERRNNIRIVKEDIHAQIKRQVEERDFITNAIREALEGPRKIIFDKANHNWADTGYRLKTAEAMADGRVENSDTPFQKSEPIMPPPEKLTRDALIQTPEPDKIISVEKGPEDPNWTQFVIGPENVVVKKSKTDDSFEVVFNNKTIAKGEVTNNGPVYSLEPQKKILGGKEEMRAFGKAKGLALTFRPLSKT